MRTLRSGEPTRSSRPVPARAGAALLGLLLLVVPPPFSALASAQEAPPLPASALASASATPVSIEATVTDVIDATAAGPVARSVLRRSPPRAEAVANLSNLVVGLGGLPLLPDVGPRVSSSNPPHAPGTRSLALPGLLLLADTPSSGLARSEAGLRLEAAGMRGSVAATSHVDAREGAPSASAVSDLPTLDLDLDLDLDLAEVHVRGLRSAIELHAGPDAEPLVTYAMTLAEVRMGSEVVFGGDASGIVARGENVPVSNLAEHFRHQVPRSTPFGVDALVASFRLLEPRVETSGDGDVSVTAPALEATVSGSGGIAPWTRLRLAAASASVASPAGQGSPMEPPPLVPRRRDAGTGPFSSSPSDVAGTPSDPSAPDPSPSVDAPAPVSSPLGRLDRGRRDRSSLRSLVGDSNVMVVVMGAAALNAVLVIARGAYLLARRRGRGSRLGGSNSWFTHR